MAAGGGAGPKRPVSLAWGNKGLFGRWAHPKCEEALGLSDPQANIARGTKETLSSPPGDALAGVFM